MQDMMSHWASSNGFLPHGHCYLWTPALLWTYVVSEAVIVLSYFSIPAGILYFVEKREDLEFNWMFLLFSLFIFACGITHLMGIWTIWHPDYWLDAALKAFTALVSVITAALLWPLIPRVLKMPTPKQLDHLVAQLQQEIGRRNAAEQQLLQTNKTLEQRSQQLEAANQELQAFSYSVSHDLRAPLRGIDGWSLALKEDCADRLEQTGRGYLDTIRSEAQRMGQLIDDLLQFSRTSHAEMKIAAVDLSALAQTVSAQLQQAQAGRRIEFAIQPGLTAVGDAHLLEVVLTNLFGNAVKFTAPRPLARVEFGVEQQPDPQTKALQPVFFVRDNGVGFDMAHAKKLFGAFQRMHTVSEFPGTGIGLATVQRIVLRHRGRVWADAKIGRGATIYFTVGKPS